MRRSHLVSASLGWLALSVAFVAGCGGSSGGGGGSVASGSLSGTILASPLTLTEGGGPSGLPGVLVEVVSGTLTKSATTDVNGNFIVLNPPTGQVHLHVDASGVAGNYGSLELLVTVGGGNTNITQSIVLPNLDNGQSVDVAVDGTGMTSGETTVGDPMVDGFSLTIPDMTTILLDGAVPSAPVPINVTMVSSIDTPMPMPGNLNPAAFVTIQPPGASFDPPLDLTLPNLNNFPLGTLVDIWSFDHGDAAWVNRSEQTGTPGNPNRGMVVDIGGTTFIVATGVITEGGWHSGTIPVDLECATTITGQVFTLGAPTPLPNVLIGLSTGQFATTDADGRFSIASVPAYDASMLPDMCVPADVGLRAIAPVSYGSQQVTMVVPAGTVMTGGTTDLGAFDVPVLSTGSLVGSVTEAGQPAIGTVSFTGTADFQVKTDSVGSFFVTNLDPGPYTASFDFTAGEQMRAFTIVQNQTTVLDFAGTPQQGGNVTVQVLGLSGGSIQPVSGACVTLQGANGAPSFLTASSNGIAIFSNASAGPYTVTAQQDVGTLRLASTLVGVLATGSPPTIIVPFLDDGGGGFNPPITDATINGTLSNAPMNQTFEYQIGNDSLGFSAFGYAGQGFMDDIPSGIPLDAVVTATDPLTGEIASAVIATGLMATSGQTLDVDFDFTNACLFDQKVEVTYQNEQPSDFLDASLEMFGTGSFSFPMTQGQAFPTSVHWPDLSSAKLTSFEPVYEVDSFKFTTFSTESWCDLPIGHTTPPTLTVNFLGSPTILAPTNNANFPTYGSGDVVSFSFGSGVGATTGINVVTFFNDNLAKQFFGWSILMASSSTSLTVPPTFKPQFGDGFCSVTVENLRFDFPGFDFPTFFGTSLPSNVEAIQASTLCAGDTTHAFTIGQLPANADGRGALQRRLELQRKRHPPLLAR